MQTKVEFFHDTSIPDIEVAMNIFLSKPGVVFISSNMAQSSYVFGEGDDEESVTKITVCLYYKISE